MPTNLDTTAAAIGRGIVAGLAGTAAMRLVTALERDPRGPEATDIPAEGAARVLGIDAFEDQHAVERTSQVVHWGYGTAMGAVRGLLARTGMGRNIADTVFHGVVWGSEQALLPALGLAPPVPRWDREDLVADLAHHTVYSLTTNAVYRWLSR